MAVIPGLGHTDWRMVYQGDWTRLQLDHAEAFCQMATTPSDPVMLLRWDQADTVKDTLFDDVVKPVFLPGVIVPAMVSFSPDAEELKEWGEIDKRPDVLFYLSLVVLGKLGLSVDSRDRLTYRGKTYDIFLDFRYRDMGGNVAEVKLAAMQVT